MKRKSFYTAIIFLFLICRSYAVDLTFKFTPTAEIPLQTSGVKRYGPLGGGGFFDFGVDLFNFMNVGAEFGYIVLPKANSSEIQGSNKSVTFTNFGLQLGTFFYPFSRVEMDFGIAGGACISRNGSNYHYGPWYRAFADVYYRINPNFAIGGNASWFDTQHDTYWGNPGSMGVAVGLSLKYKFDTNKTVRNVVSSAAFDDSVFPLLYSLYRQAPFGTITIENNESAEIRNVRVTFRAGKYTSTDMLCGTTRIIKKHNYVEIPMLADWNNNILQFAEEGKIPGEVIVEYELLGKKRTAISQVIVPVYNRNQMRWEDTNAIASFISTTSQEVLEFSKVLVGISRNHLRSGLNRNMQFAMYLFNGMPLAGIECRKSEDTPYEEYHVNPELIDYIQYPFQTIQFKSGDVDELGILYMAMLESVGIQSGFIPLKDDFIVCINLGLDVSKTMDYFNSMDRVLSLDDEIWIPVSMANLREGFTNSWYHALKKIDNATEAIEFVLLADAWQTYPPSGYTTDSSMNLRINEKALSSAGETDMARYVTAEFGPKIKALLAKIKKEGGSVELYNKLGMLYVRAGMYSDAKSVYKISASNGSVTAMNNLGNICYLQKEYKEAKKWYQMALKNDPNNATAQKNLIRLEGAME